jgi:hypothetical protein
MNPLLLLANIALASTSSRKDLDGIEHLVIPCIAIKEGVLNNIFYSANELETFANTWNGVPVPVNHPSDEKGLNVTANSVISENNVNIGRFYNAFWDSDSLSLKGELWLNIPKAKKLGYIHIIEKLEGNELMEVSTGLFGDTVESKGTYKEESYDYVISNIRPDHIALLPDSIGACSIKQGCGAMRTNEDKTKKGFFNWIKGLFVNEKSFDQIREGIYKSLKVELGDDNWPYILDIFDQYFVYEFSNKYFRRNYTVDETETIILVGENIEVRLERKYVPVSAETIINKHTMKPKKKEAIINALAVALGVAATVFANSEDTKLEEAATKHGFNFDDDGNEVKTNCGCNKPKETVTNTVVPIYNGLSNEQAATLARLQANEEKRLDKKRETVLATNKNLTKEIVATFNEDALDALLVNVDKSVDYSIAGAQPVNNEYKAPSVILGD